MALPLPGRRERLQPVRLLDAASRPRLARARADELVPPAWRGQLPARRADAPAQPDLRRAGGPTRPARPGSAGPRGPDALYGGAGGTDRPALDPALARVPGRGDLRRGGHAEFSGAPGADPEPGSPRRGEPRRRHDGRGP